MRSLQQPRWLDELIVGSAFCRSIDLPLQTTLADKQIGRHQAETGGRETMRDTGFLRVLRRRNRVRCRQARLEQ